MNPVQEISVAITFHYREMRLKYLESTCSSLAGIQQNIKVHVMTNANEQQAARVSALLDRLGISFEIHFPSYLGHPYLLSWSHLAIFRRVLKGQPRVSHFLYLEDDTIFPDRNIDYWLTGRSRLREHGLIPSFMRYELMDSDHTVYSTDLIEPVPYESAPKIVLPDQEYAYIGLPKCYQGMYFLDRELMEEYFSASINPNRGHWGILEKATQGVTFLNVPEGFNSRNVVGYSCSDRAIDQGALIHHSPNNYATNPASPFGKVPVSGAIIHD